MKRISPYLDAAVAALAVVFGYAGQIGDNLVYLAGTDLADQHIEHDLERIQQIMASQQVTDLIASIKAEEDQLVPLVQGLIADKGTQAARIAALESQIEALTAAGDDPTTLAALQGLRDSLVPLLTELTPAPAAAAPVPVVSVPVAPVPITPDPSAPVAPLPDPAQASVAGIPAGSDAAAQVAPDNPTAPPSD